MANFIVFEHNEKRTKNSKTFRMHSGDLQTQIFMGDIHYEDEFDNLQNIDTDLDDEADFDEQEDKKPVSKHSKDKFKEIKERVKADKKKGKLDRDKHDFQGLRVPFRCKLPKKFSKGYSIGKGDNELTFIPIGVSNAKGDRNDNDRSIVEYQDPWNDVDVSLQITDRGIKETLTLKTDKAPTKFTFEVRGKLDGELKLQPPWLVDNKGEKRDVQQTIREENHKTYIDLIADVSGLEFPIKVDPTSTVTLSQVKIDQANPSGNYNGQLIDLGRYSTGERRNGLFKASLAIPQGAIISDATLNFKITQLYGSCQSPYGSNKQLILTPKKITSDWETNTATFNNTTSVAVSGVTSHISQPPNWGESMDYSSGIYVGWKSVSITPIVQAWCNGETNRGVMLESDLGNWPGSYGGMSVYLSNSEMPYYSITYSVPPTAPTLTSPNGGETWNASHTITWNPATDASEASQLTITTSTLTPFAGWTHIGQTFKVDRDSFITKVSLLVRDNSNSTFILSLRNSSGGLPGSTVYASTTISGITQGSDQRIELTLPTPLKFPINTNLAVDVRCSSGNLHFRGATSNSYNDGTAYYSDNGGNNYYTNTYDLNCIVNFDEANPALQYNIELSTDGTTYPVTISALTSAGATSLDYDFSAIPQTSTAKVRIRAYDGSAYGPWDESNGVFTIQHNQAPTAPTNLAPNGSAQDRAATIRLSWQHNDPNTPDPQSKFDLQYSVNDGGSWTTVTQTTTNQYLDIAGGTFAHGAVLWKVRTYDQADVAGPYSAQATFLAGDKPGTPTITNPADEAIVAVANPTVQWSSSGQTAYQLQAIDSLNATVYDSNEVTSTNKAQTITAYDFANEEAYTLKLRVKNADGIWSDWISVVVSVSYTPPATPTIVLTAQAGYISLAITNPEPTGTEPSVTSCDVYRRKSVESSWARIAKGIVDSYADYAIASGVTYEYKVRAYGDNGTYADSANSSLSINLKGIWLHDVTDPTDTIHQYKTDVGRSSKWQPEVALMQFSGRSSPVSEFEEEVEDSRVNVNLVISNKTLDLATLESLAFRRSTLCFRDSKGRKVFGIIPQLPVIDQKHGNSVALEIIKTAYSEVV